MKLSKKISYQHSFLFVAILLLLFTPKLYTSSDESGPNHICGLEGMSRIDLTQGCSYTPLIFSNKFPVTLNENSKDAVAPEDLITVQIKENSTDKIVVDGEGLTQGNNSIDASPQNPVVSISSEIAEYPQPSKQLSENDFFSREMNSEPIPYHDDDNPEVYYTEQSINYAGPINVNRQFTFCNYCPCECNWWEKSCEYSPWEYPLRFHVDHTMGEWLDNEERYTTIGAFAASTRFLRCNFVPFVDARFHYFNDGKIGANVGLGVRFLDYLNMRVLGANIFYDYRENNIDHYEQLGLGIEYLSPCWDFRLNGYIGEKKGRSRLHVFDDFIGDWKATCREKQNSMSGFDFEFGKWLLSNCGCNFLEIYGALGGHYYSNNWEKKYYGYQGRVEARFLRYLSLEVKGGYNRVYNGMLQGVISFTYPFTCPPSCRSNRSCRCDCLREEALQPVNRQWIIALDEKCCCWTWNWDSPSQ